jgi:sugar phosphate isomerase/epimerase
MASFAPSLNLLLAPTVGPAVRQSGLSLSKVLDQFTKAGFASVQLDATLPGLRPRELSGQGRRDLLGLFKRRDMILAGLDLFIPRRDLLDKAKVDRAMSAILAGIELAADLGRQLLSLALPVNELSEPTLATIVEAADARGVTLAVHAEDQLQALRDWVTRVDLPVLGMGMDPAGVLAHHDTADEMVHRHARKLVGARLSDFQVTGGGNDASRSGLRCQVGQGELNLPDYRLALELATGRHGPVVLDLRQMENVMLAATQGKEAWDTATPG